MSAWLQSNDIIEASRHVTGKFTWECWSMIETCFCWPSRCYKSDVKVTGPHSPAQEHVNYEIEAGYVKVRSFSEGAEDFSDGRVANALASDLLALMLCKKKMTSALFSSSS